MKRNKTFYLGFLGFLGFSGFQYFHSHNAIDLCGFAFFSFFAYFWMARIKVSIPDERYYEDVKKAKAFAFDIGVMEMIVLFLLSIFVEPFREFIIIGVALCYSSLIITYAVKLYLLEEK